MPRKIQYTPAGMGTGYRTLGALGSIAQTIQSSYEADQRRQQQRLSQNVKVGLESLASGALQPDDPAWRRVVQQMEKFDPEAAKMLDAQGRTMAENLRYDPGRALDTLIRKAFHAVRDDPSQDWASTFQRIMQENPGLSGMAQQAGLIKPTPPDMMSAPFDALAQDLDQSELLAVSRRRQQDPGFAEYWRMNRPGAQVGQARRETRARQGEEFEEWKRRQEYTRQHAPPETVETGFAPTRITPKQVVDSDQSRYDAWKDLLEKERKATPEPKKPRNEAQAAVDLQIMQQTENLIATHLAKGRISPQDAAAWQAALQRRLLAGEDLRYASEQIKKLILAGYSAATTR